MGLFEATRENSRGNYAPFLEGNGEAVLEVVSIIRGKSQKNNPFTSFNFRVVGKDRSTTGKQTVVNGTTHSADLILDKIYTKRFCPAEAPYAGGDKDQLGEIGAIILALSGFTTAGIAEKDPELFAFLGLDPDDYDLDTKKGQGALDDDGEKALARVENEAIAGEGTAWAGRRLHVTMRAKPSKKDPTKIFTNFAWAPLPTGDDLKEAVRDLAQQGWTFSESVTKG